MRPPLLATLAEVLDQGRELVVLDNCEHLVDACAAVAAHLLSACPAHTCTSLRPAASRSALAAEVIWRVLFAAGLFGHHSAQLSNADGRREG